jgi:hypothetical protein
VCWGHDTDVLEYYIRDFIGNWTLTNATIAGSGDGETLTLNPITSVATSEDRFIGVGTSVISLNYYQAGTKGPPLIEYRTASTRVGLAGAVWTIYDGVSLITCLGWMTVRLSLPV